eukprot:TRINITY_DN19470_c0_g1_i1.p1 TRINITY_DN19470_c0_g1~~TRINITY_DN19470_c0_g1_i1.p1  ORF type:complete len:116 (-),score=3.09 TRINITY_DN19470_c0_g1_i1:89-436(-)
MYILLIVIFLLLGILIVVVFIRLKKQYVVYTRLLVLSGVSLVGGISIWLPEEVFNYCVIPSDASSGGISQFQILHGLWHILTCLSLLFLYCFLRSLSFANLFDALLWRPAILKSL